MTRIFEPGTLGAILLGDRYMAKEDAKTTHIADIMCGKCGELTRIALGMASAIACPGCRTEIVLGEDDTADDLPLQDQFRVMPCDYCRSTAVPVGDRCPACGSLAPHGCQVVVKWR